MKIAENVHLIRKEFYVTPEVKRYINLYLITGESCYLIDSGVSGSKKIIDEYRQQAKGIIVDNDYKELIEKSKDIDKFYSYSQSSIISEDLYKEVLETINNRNLTNEEIEK